MRERQTDRQRGRVEDGGRERGGAGLEPNGGNKSSVRLVEPQECSETATTVSVFG